MEDRLRERKVVLEDHEASVTEAGEKQSKILSAVLVEQRKTTDWLTTAEERHKEQLAAQAETLRNSTTSCQGQRIQQRHVTEG
jgi:hypothetical protein